MLQHSLILKQLGQLLLRANWLLGVQCVAVVCSVMQCVAVSVCADSYVAALGSAC